MIMKIEKYIKDDTVVSGLLMVTVCDLSGKDMTIRIGEKVVYHTFQGSEVHFYVLTHLFKDGQHSIIINNSAEEKSIDVMFMNKGKLASAVKSSLIANKSDWLHFDKPDSSWFDYDEKALMPWFNQSEAKASEYISEIEVEYGKVWATRMESFYSDGYLIIEDAISSIEIDSFVKDLDHGIEKEELGFSQGSSDRIKLLHHRYPSAAHLFKHPSLMQALSLIFNEDPRPCQSLTFVNGSQQSLHQDSIHLTPFPAGYMCGAWLALEDIQEGSGELIVIPGSHRSPIMRMADLGMPKVENDDWEPFVDVVGPIWGKFSREASKPVVYRPKKGTLLIWHENLLHGGSERINYTLTRKAFVTHHYGNGSIAFYDSTGTVGTMEFMN